MSAAPSTRLWRFVLVAGMLVTGSINTLSKRAQNQSHAVGLDGVDERFVKPWSQTLMMFVGEILCLFLFVFCIRDVERGIEVRRRVHHVHAKEPTLTASTTVATRTAADAEEARTAHRLAELEAQQPVVLPPPAQSTPFYIFSLPAFCDVLGTTFGGIGLVWVDGSVWQMLRGSIIIFSGILSIIFLKRKFSGFHWLAITIVATGLCIVGVSSYWGSQHHRKENDEGKMLLGFGFIVFGQLCSASQLVLEEVLVKNRGLHPAKVVGLEGTWGALIMLVLVLPICYLIPGSDHGSYENSLDAIANLQNNHFILYMGLLYTTSTAFFNFFSLSVAKQLSTIHRTLIDAMRTMLIWTVDLFVFYYIDPAFGEQWTPYSVYQMCGFALLIVGTLVYNEVLRLPFASLYPDAAHHDESMLLIPKTTVGGRTVVVPVTVKGVSPTGAGSTHAPVYPVLDARTPERA